MKHTHSFSRYNIFWTMMLCYVLPMLSITLYGSISAHPSEMWNVFSLGLFAVFCGALILFWRLARWEQTLRLQVCPEKLIQEDSEETSSIDLQEYDFTKRALTEAQQTQIRLLEEIETLTNNLRQEAQNQEQMLQEKASLQTQLEQTKQNAMLELEKQQRRIRELQESVASQKDISEKKQQQLLQLENKVGDLTGEIKTLLKLAEAHHSTDSTDVPAIENTPVIPPINIEEHAEISPSDYSTKTSAEASHQMKICLEIAQKIKGSQRFGSQIYSFLDSPAEHFSLDLRRLCDRLRGESEIMVLFYAPQNHHLLFASNQIKSLTGWSPEKFVQNFHDLLLNEQEWTQGINSLAMRTDVHIPLQLKTKSGTVLSINACLGMIPTGIFRNHTMAVLYTESSASALT